MSEQLHLQRTHYELFGFSRDPSSNPDEANYKMMADNKKQVIGAAKILLDELNCECITIFKVKGV